MPGCRNTVSKVRLSRSFRSGSEKMSIGVLCSRSFVVDIVYSGSFTTSSSQNPLHLSLNCLQYSTLARLPNRLWSTLTKSPLTENRERDLVRFGLAGDYRRPTELTLKWYTSVQIMRWWPLHTC